MVMKKKRKIKSKAKHWRRGDQKERRRGGRRKGSFVVPRLSRGLPLVKLASSLSRHAHLKLAGMAASVGHAHAVLPKVSHRVGAPTVVVLDAGARLHKNTLAAGV
jgi:hypothetical protein